MLRNFSLLRESMGLCVGLHGPNVSFRPTGTRLRTSFLQLLSLNHARQVARVRTTRRSYPKAMKRVSGTELN